MLMFVLLGLKDHEEDFCENIMKHYLFTLCSVGS